MSLLRFSSSFGSSLLYFLTSDKELPMRLFMLVGGGEIEESFISATPLLIRNFKTPMKNIFKNRNQKAK